MVDEPGGRAGRNDPLRVLVLGYVVRFPLGGMTWHYLHYALGLLEMGHDVYFLEDSDDYRECCYDPTRSVSDPDPTYGIGYATSVFDRVGMGNRWAYYDAHRGRWLGPCADGVAEIIATADLLLNVSASNPLRPWLMEVPVRVMIDTDPAFQQVRQLTVPARRELALRHNRFLSFGENIEAGRAELPDDGLAWKSTRQPVVLSHWQPAAPDPRGPFSTVMQWDSYPSRDFGGRRYGMKSESFGPYIDLPARTRADFEVVLTGPNAPTHRFRELGWRLADGYRTTRDPWTYQEFLRRSKAEFSVAKQGYVASRSGWFSERSACYMASGRPVLVQDTGFSDWLPTGLGVVPFSSPDEAVEGVMDIQGRYPEHCRAARELAAEYFEAKKVLSQILARI